MKCRKCHDKAIAYLPAHNLALCKSCYSPWFLERTQSTINKFKMFGRGDRILVAVSGGKDSLSLWHALAQLGYQTVGLYIHLGIDHKAYSDKSKEASEKMSQIIGAKLHVVDVSKEVGATIPELRNLTSRVICSSCGLVKRYFMNKIASGLGCDVLATGHNLDDETAALLGNVLRWQTDYLARQGPVLEGRDGFKRKVKPFVYFTEKETTLYALVNQLPFVRDECPFSVGASSIFYKEMLNRIEHESPGTKLSFYNGFLKQKQAFSQPAPEIKACSVCGQPTAGDVCAFCRLVGRVQDKKNKTATEAISV